MGITAHRCVGAVFVLHAIIIFQSSQGVTENKEQRCEVQQESIHHSNNRSPSTHIQGSISL